MNKTSWGARNAEGEKEEILAVIVFCAKASKSLIKLVNIMKWREA